MPVAGSYSSAVEVELLAPTTSTLPESSRVAAAPLRTSCVLPVGVQVSVAGSYSSAAAASPRTTRTLPEDSNVAVDATWSGAMLAAEDQVRVAGSYSSAVALPALSASTLPEGSSVKILCDISAMSPVSMKPPESCSQVAPPVIVKVMEADRPWAFTTVAVTDSGVLAGTHEGAVHCTSLRVASLEGAARVPARADQWKVSALACGSIAVTRKVTGPLAGTACEDW